jgi:RNA polymerase sigma-70 factor, ECF subfamily
MAVGMVVLTATESMVGERLAGWNHVAGKWAFPRPSTLVLDPCTSDEELIASIVLKDRRAMTMLYARHSTNVYRFAVRMTGDSSLAEDVVSEVFLEVWRGAEGFQSRSRVSTWLIAIARNKALTARRQRQHEPLDRRRAISIADAADDPEVSCGKKDRSETIRRCVAQLSAAQREVIDLVYYHGRSIEEVAHIVGAPVGTVKTRMFYARRRMEKLLRPSGIGLHS